MWGCGLGIGVAVDLIVLYWSLVIVVCEIEGGAGVVGEVVISIYECRIWWMIGLMVD